MHLTFGGARTDRSPTHQVGNVLGRNHIQVFDARRNPELVEFQEQLAAYPYALVDLETAIEVGIVDQALPADGRARLLKVHPHDEEYIPGQPIFFGLEPSGVLQCSLRIMNRTGAHDREYPVVISMQYLMNRLACLVCQRRNGLADGKFAQHVIWRRQLFDLGNAKVVSPVQHLGHSSIDHYRQNGIEVCNPLQWPPFLRYNHDSIVPLKPIDLWD